MKISSRQINQAERNLLERFRVFPNAVRWHAWLRLRSFPFQQLLKLLPDQGTLLDFGCGFGCLSYLVSSMAPRRTIVAFDPASEKIQVAEKLLPQARVTTVFTDIPPGVQVVVILDVLYLLPPRKRLKALRNVYKILVHKGTIVVAFVPKEWSWRYMFAWLQEWLMVQGVNKTHHSGAIDFETETWMRNALVKAGFGQLNRYVLPTPWPWWHKHVVYTATKAGK